MVVGLVVGMVVGLVVGLADGDIDGEDVGLEVGTLEGASEGNLEGDTVAIIEGAKVEEVVELRLNSTGNQVSSFMQGGNGKHDSPSLKYMHGSAHFLDFVSPRIAY